MKIESDKAIKTIGAAIGIGIIAGLVGTAAITLSQTIEMKIDGREPSDAPVKAVRKTLNVAPTFKNKAKALAQEVHWTYGTTWGIARGLIALTGLKGIPASILHFAAIWGTELWMLPTLKVAPPITEEKPQEIAVDALHHAVYAAATGLAFDALVKN